MSTRTKRLQNSIKNVYYTDYPYLAFETIHDEIKQGNWAIADGRKAAKSVEEYLGN
jgi:hypothetical protein